MRTVVFASMVAAFGIGAAPAADLFVGTWKHVPAKSSNNWDQKPGTNVTRTYVANDKGGYQVKIEGVDADGKPISATLDAATNAERAVGENPAPVVKLLGATHVLSRRVDDRTLEATYLKDGKKVGASTTKISEDGKILTMTLKGTSTEGKELTATNVYEK